MFRHGVDPADKILYTTGRLTSEMVIKTVRMGIPILVSRFGLYRVGRRTWRRQVGVELVGAPEASASSRCRDRSASVYDQNLEFVAEESRATSARVRP